WSWKFRTLKAEVLLREGLPMDALTLLVAAPPDGLPADIVVRKRLVQGQALCTLNRHAEAATVLETAQTAISPSDFLLGAELAFQRGMCAISDPQTAQKHFERAVQLGRGHDDFITARALISWGYSLSKHGQYVDAISKLNDALSITHSLLLREKAFGLLAECY